MLLAIDIGNTRVCIALFKGEGIVARWSCVTSLLSTESRIGRLLREGFDPSFKRAMAGMCISSVVPKIDAPFKRACRNYFGIDPIFVTPENCGLKISGYDKKQIGADRLVNSVAAYEKFKGSIIVIDAGSCITFDAVSNEGQYLGGAIAPGIPLATKSLNEMTAQLPLVEIKKPKKAIGKSTEQSVQSGIYNGYSGLIEKVIEAISGELEISPKIVCTGGDAKLISKMCKNVDFVYPDLTFDGIRIVYENAKRMA